MGEDSDTHVGILTSEREGRLKECRKKSLRGRGREVTDRASAEL
jgi:hypothetical protein